MNPEQRYMNRKNNDVFGSRNRLPAHHAVRSRSKSPRNYNPNKSFITNTSQTSSRNNSILNVQMLKDSEEDNEIVSAQCIQLMRHEERNITNFKKSINEEKKRITSQLQSLKTQINHVVEDYRLSVLAVLDRIYQNYITRYADMKSEVMEVNRMKDQIQSQINGAYLSKHSPVKDKYGSSSPSVYSNQKTIRSLEKGRSSIRRLQLMKYLTQLQKQKSIPIQQKCQELLILTEYTNGFYQSQQFLRIKNQLVRNFREEFRSFLSMFPQYIRDPESLLCKERQYKNHDENGQKGYHTVETKNSQPFPQFNQQVTVMPVKRENAHYHINLTENDVQGMKNYPVSDSIEEVGGPYHRNDNAYSNQIHSQPFLPNNPPNSEAKYSPNSLRNQIFLNHSNNNNEQHYYQHNHQHSHQHSHLQHPQSIISSTSLTIDSLKIKQVSEIKSISPDIILSCVWATQSVVAVGNKDGSLVFYDVNKNSSTIPGSSRYRHKSSVCTLALIKDRQYLASGSDHPHPQIIIWSLQRFEPLFSLIEHKSAVTAIACLRDSEHFISGSYDKKLCVYSLDQQKIKYMLPSNKVSVTAICLNSNGTKLISCGLEGSVLNIWQIVKDPQFQRKVDTLFLEQIIQNNTTICSVLPSAMSSEIIFVGTKDGKIKIVNIIEGSSVKTLSCCHSAIIQLLSLQQHSSMHEQHNLLIILAWPCKQKCFKIIDCENGKISNTRTSGQLQFSCGVGPKCNFNISKTNFVMGSQGEDRKIYIYGLDSLQ